MARAGGVPRGRALKTMAKIIDSRTSATTVTRPTTSTNALDESTETTTTSTEDLWLTSEAQSISEEVTGERLNAALIAHGTDGIDLQADDRVDYGGVTYEVDTVIGHPEDADADGSSHSETNFFVATLTRYDA